MAERAMVETDMLAMGKPFGENGDAARAAAADRAMEELADVLAEPEYTGDLQTALIHYMRRDAFDWFTSDNLVKDFVNLEQKIVKVASKAPEEGLVPVVMSFQTVNGSSDDETALVVVDPAEPHFRSSVEHSRDVRRHGFAGPLAITDRSIALLGTTVRLEGLDLAHHSVYFQKGQDAAAGRARYAHPRGSLVLHATKLTDGRNSADPPKDHGLEGASEEADLFYNNQRPLVGWKEVTAAVSRGVLDIRESAETGEDRDAKALRYIKGLLEFFDKAGQVDTLLGHSGRELKKVLGEAAAFTEALGKLANKERPPRDSSDDEW